MNDKAKQSNPSTGSVAKFRPIGAYVHTPTYEDLFEEVKRLRLTDAEREAIATAAVVCEGIGFDALPALLRGLLARTK